MPLIQKNGGTIGLSASIATSLPGATTAGNTILIFAQGSGTISTPSGFTSRSPQVNFQGLYLFEKLVASGNSSDTPTLTMSGAYTATWQIVEYSNITAFDTSSGNNSFSTSNGVYTTPSITPTSGSRRLVAFVGGGTTGNQTWTSGDPQGWTNPFTGQQSNSTIGAASPANQNALAGGFADFLVTAVGLSYQTGASMSASGGGRASASIIASYTTTDVPPIAFGDIIQINGGSGSGPTSFNATLPGAITAGNMVVIMVVANNVPSGANTGWTKSTGMSPVANAQGLLWWFKATGGDTIPTVTFASAAKYAWRIVEYAGPFNASPYETSGGSAANGAFTDIGPTTAITPTAGNPFLIIAGLGGQDGADHWNFPSVTIGSFTNSFTNASQQFRQANPESHLACQVSRVVASASGSYSTTGTCSLFSASGASCRVGMTIAFKGVGRPVKVWNGTAWGLKPVKVWSGSAWVTKPAKVWNGSAWV